MRTRRREDRTEMAVALEHEIAALPHADARPGVHSFSPIWVSALVASDATGDVMIVRARGSTGREVP